MRIDVSNALAGFIDSYSEDERATMSYAELRLGLLRRLKTAWRASMQNLPELVPGAEKDARARQLDMQENYAARPELVPPPLK